VTVTMPPPPSEGEDALLNAPNVCGHVRMQLLVRARDDDDDDVSNRVENAHLFSFFVFAQFFMADRFCERILQKFRNIFEKSVHACSLFMQSVSDQFFFSLNTSPTHITAFHPIHSFAHLHIHATHPLIHAHPSPRAHTRTPTGATCTGGVRISRIATSSSV
jgi:hypothetical protein